jgi:hypothetical protein
MSGAKSRYLHNYFKENYNIDYFLNLKTTIEIKKKIKKNKYIYKKLKKIVNVCAINPTEMTLNKNIFDIFYNVLNHKIKVKKIFKKRKIN